MNDSELDTSEPLELLRLVHNGHISMHRLHAQDLIIALLVVKHRCGEIFKYVLAGKRSISLSRDSARNGHSEHRRTCIHSCQMKKRWL